MTTSASSAALQADPTPHPLQPHRDFFGESTVNPCSPQESGNRSLASHTHCLIVTLPDASDSKLASAFDAYLEATQRAMEAEGYVLDRSWNPWSRLRQIRDPAKRRQFRAESIEQRPGTLLFRRATIEKNAPPRTDLITVFLVGETPTSGIHKRAFLEAVAHVRSISGELQPLRIVGPTFSGSAVSLRAVLAKLCPPRKPEPPASATSGMLAVWARWLEVSTPSQEIFIVSGSATAIDGNTFSDLNGVHYSTTVVQGSDVMNCVRERLADYGGRVAVLKESNTSYGNNPNQKTRDDLIEIPFPLHISQTLTALKSQQSQNDYQRALASSESRLPFPVEYQPIEAESAAVQDPAMTNVSNDLILSNILSTVKREKITILGIHATDARDKIFLAAMIREHCPDVRLFTLGSDLLLAHPEFAFSMRGAIVASTYPLHPSIQLWTKPRQRGRFLLFQQQGTQGLYNAILAQLTHAANNGNKGHQGDSNSPDTRMVGYSVPRLSNEPALRNTNRPPIWLSVVSPTGRLIPLAFYSLSDNQGKSLQPREATDEWNINVHYNSLCAAIVLALSGYCAWLFWIAIRICRSPPTNASALVPLVNLFWPNVLGNKFLAKEERSSQRIELWKQAIGLAFCLGSLALLYGFFAHLSAIHWYLNSHSTGTIDLRDLLMLTITVVCMVGLLVLLGYIPWLGYGSKSGKQKDGTRQWLWIYPAIALVLAAILGESLSYRISRMSAQDALFFERTVDLSSGLSPLLPAMCLMAAYFSWGYFQLRRSHLLSYFSVLNPFVKADQPATPLLQAIRNLHTPIRSTLIDSPSKEELRWMGILILAAGPACWLLLGRFPPHTFESPFYTWFFFAAFMFMALVLALTFINFLRLWKLVRRMLKHLSIVPLARAFDTLPKEVAGMFSGYLYTLRPRQSHFATPMRQYSKLRRRLLDSQDPVSSALEAVLANDANLVANLRSAFAKDLTADYEKELHEPAAVRRKVFWGDEDAEDPTIGESLDGLRNASAATMTVLEKLWQDFGPEEVHCIKEMKDEPDPLAHTREWIQLAESFVATQAVLYISQFFVHLRNLLWSVTIGAFFLIIAATSYPYQPQNLLLLSLMVGVGAISFGIVKVFVQINRDPFVSRLSDSVPERFTPDWGFLRSFSAYVLPLLGMLTLQLSGAFRSLVEPLFNLMR